MKSSPPSLASPPIKEEKKKERDEEIGDTDSPGIPGCAGAKAPAY